MAQGTWDSKRDVSGKHREKGNAHTGWGSVSYLDQSLPLSLWKVLSLTISFFPLFSYLQTTGNQDKKAFDFTDKRHLKYKIILFPLLSGAEFPQIAFITAKSFVFKCFKFQWMANGRLISMRTTLKSFFKAGQNTSSPSPCDCGAWSPAAPWPSGSDCAPCRRRGSRSKCQHRRWAGESAGWLPIFEHNMVRDVG